MKQSDGDGSNLPASDLKPKKLGRSITLGLCLGIACGIFLGEYCQPLQTIGDAYVGLLQMTVLPYLVLSLTGKLGRLNVAQARELSLSALAVMITFSLVAIVLIVLVSHVFPSVEGASFYSPRFEQSTTQADDFLTTFVPTNIFRSLTQEYVPAVVVFCLFFGWALMLVPGKERLIDLMDLLCDGISRINMFLVQLAPWGLFALSAAAAGTMRIDELSRLKAYLIVFTIACAAAAFVALPLLVSSLTEIRYRDLMRAASQPILTAIATGKLFVVLPQIIERCDELLANDTKDGSEADSQKDESSASVLVPLAYPFPHVGKILVFIFVSFAAWYSGNPLDTGETFSMASAGAMSSFASPLISIPFLLDQQELPQDLMAMFILPGFITMRMGDVVGVVHLMALTAIVSRRLQGRLHIQWARLAIASAVMIISLVGVGFATRIYLASTNIVYDLDKRLLALDIASPTAEAKIYSTSDRPPLRTPPFESTLERLKRERVLRVGFHPDHLPFSYFNSSGKLVGMDVELMHRLATRLDARLEFIPYDYPTALDQLNQGQFDVVIGGMMIKPERLLLAGFSKPYLSTTVAIATLDHHRSEYRNWDDLRRRNGLKLGAVYEDVAVVASRQAPGSEIQLIKSYREYFDLNRQNLDGLIIPAEEGATWNVLYPKHAIVVPTPIIKRPIGMAVRSDDRDWQDFLDGWIDFEIEDGALQELRTYWLEGGGTRQRPPRWSIASDVLGWLP